MCPIEGARYLAQNICGARLVELPGNDHIPFVGNGDAIVDAIEEFLTGVRPTIEADRVLMTVMVVDIVESTRFALELGGHRWRDLLATYRAAVRKELARYCGTERSSSGDGFLATVDGPARAIRCANGILQAVQTLGLEVRIGLHTGECELMGEDISGVAVHIGARVAGHAKAGEILVSSTVKELVVGSGIEFIDRGQHTLKGVPGLWRLYTVDQGSSPLVGTGSSTAPSVRSI
jgi:class 3 adenylate cyclase